MKARFLAKDKISFPGMSSAKSMESITDTRSMVTAVSGSDVERAATPTENDVSHVYFFPGNYFQNWLLNYVLNGEIKMLVPALSRHLHRRRASLPEGGKPAAQGTFHSVSYLLHSSL